MLFVRALLTAGALLAAHVATAQSDRTSDQCGGEVDRTPLSLAQRLFYNGDYAQAAALTSTACGSADSLELCELRTSALLMRLKRDLGEAHQEDPSQTCVRCQQLIASFVADTARGQTAARARLRTDAADEATQFLLAKLDLNYVWLQLGVLGRKTGWREYWEARRSVDKVLKTNPSHLRARVARAWIDYIVDTRMPLGTRWLLGGGDKKRGLLTIREAARADGHFYARAEAAFALWDVQIREKQIEEAVVTARRLSCDFPANEELRRFLQKHGTTHAPEQVDHVGDIQ